MGTRLRMMRKTAVLALVGSAAAFAPSAVPSLRTTKSVCTMQAEGGVSRRDILSGLAGAAVVAAPAIANADVEYPNVPYLGGSDTVDVNNANIRVYTKFPGMYPTIAGVIVKNSPYTSPENIFEKVEPKLSPEQQAIFSKYKKNLVALKAAPEYQEDIWNNGLYR